uniref:peptidoglycan editing factor PgeF n=1 Tax=Herbidospora sakaeratensis TaxID=564415 RepID=UPI000781F09A|nr:peptidoglycan editing factor PgeF [Herbidospora sakaeratensis]
MLLAEGVHAVITDRHGGVSPAPFGGRNLGGAVGDDPENVAANRRLTALEAGVDPARVVLMRQVHGREVAYVDRPFGAEPPGLDAVFTAEEGLALVSLAADCAQVLVADPVARLVGAAHSGRPGTLAGVVPALVEAMAGRGADPGRMVALVGPAACGRCYEVPAAMRDEVAAVVPEAWATTSRDTPSVDLRAAIAAQLSRAGVDDVRHDVRCTIESGDLYSYRREGQTGRFGAYIWLG